MSRPWMPLYVGDYIADTAHLSTAEHGAYLLLMMHYWAKGKLPTEDTQLARIARMTTKEWANARSVIAAFFSADWKHGRIEFELTEAERISAAGRAGGVASGEARRKKPNDRSTVVEQSLNDQGNDSPTIREALPSPSQLQEKKESILAVGRPTRPEIEKSFLVFWEKYPRREGDNPRKSALKAFTSAVHAGNDPATISAGLEKWIALNASKVGTSFVPQAVKWLHDERWKDALAASGPAKTVARSIMPGSPEFEKLYASLPNNSFQRSLMTRSEDTGQPYFVPPEYDATAFSPESQ